MIPLILRVSIMGLSTLTNIVFILRESLSIWLRYGISNFQNAGLRHFRDPEAVYNGLMVRFHGGRALTVRDRPPNVFRVE